jgi:hypothetical protein
MKFYVDEKDVTDQVEPKQWFANWRIGKTVTFDEPMYDSTLAIQGYEFNTPVSGPEYVAKKVGKRQCQTNREIQLEWLTTCMF